MKAILIKYHSPTNTKGSRVSAETKDNKRVYFPFDHSFPNMEAQARHFALTYALNMGWEFDAIHVGTIDNDIYVGVMS